MAVTFDTATSNGNFGAQVAATSITVANQPNRILVAQCMADGAGTDAVSSISGGGGGTWTKLGANVNGTRNAEIWYSIAPNTGSQSITMTLSATGGNCILGLISLYGADQTTGMNGFTSAGAAVTLSPTSPAGDMAIVAVLCNGDPGTISNGTEAWANAFGPARCGYRAGVGGATQINWPNATGRDIVGGNVIAAAAGGSVVGSYYYSLVAGQGA